MIYGIDEYEKFKVVRPLLGDHKLDFNDMPIMHKVTEEEIDFVNGIPTNIQNLSKKYKNSNKIILPFIYDCNLNKYWNDPLKYIPLLQSTMLVGTPDYSVYDSMNINEITHNIYENRWLGCLWQTYGCRAIPTISWGNSNTYDVCFSGIEPGGIVMISTIGCTENKNEFLEGFNEMKKRLKPSLIIVFGNMFDEMTGRFINYKYSDSFNDNNRKTKQLSLEITPIFEKGEK